MSEPSPPIAYRFGDFDFNQRAYELRHRGRRVRLERRPMELLSLFLERRGELLTRQEIVARLWEPDVFVDVETGVNTIVWKLRSALRDSPDAPRFIETVSGKGYRFVAPVELEFAREAPVTLPTPPLPTPPRQSPGLPAPPIEPPRQSQSEPRASALATPALPPRPNVRFSPKYVAGLVLAAAAIVGVSWFNVGSSPNGTVTIAVLPFENLSADPDRDYLADGLSEEVGASLAQLGPDRIRVIGRTSTRLYKASSKPPAQIGRELGAEYLVEGSVRVEASRVRATAKLVRVRDQVQVWAQSYDQALSSMLALQTDISAAIAAQVVRNFTSLERSAIARRQTGDPEAYDLYLRGRALWRRLTPATNHSAIAHYRRAIDRDPQYAMAWAGIADVYAGMPINADVAPREVRAEARAAAQRAFDADSELDDVLFSRGFVSYWLDWDWKRAETDFRRALAINPGHVGAHRVLGHLLSQMHRHDEARAEMRQAAALDPFDPANHALAAQVAFHARDYAAALEYARRAVTLDPEFWIGYIQEAQVYAALGQTDRALAAVATSARYSRGNSKTHSLRGYILARAGRHAEAREVLQTLSQLSTERFVPPYAFALIHAGLDEPDAALAWLEKAYDAHDVHLVFLPVDSKWDPFRDDPRFQQLLARGAFQGGE